MSSFFVQTPKGPLFVPQGFCQFILNEINIINDYHTQCCAVWDYEFERRDDLFKWEYYALKSIKMVGQIAAVALVAQSLMSFKVVPLLFGVGSYLIAYGVGCLNEKNMPDIYRYTIRCANLIFKMFNSYGLPSTKLTYNSLKSLNLYKRILTGEFYEIQKLESKKAKKFKAEVLSEELDRRINSVKTTCLLFMALNAIKDKKYSECPSLAKKGIVKLEKSSIPDALSRRIKPLFEIINTTPEALFKELNKHLVAIKCGKEFYLGADLITILCDYMDRKNTPLNQTITTPSTTINRIKFIKQANRKNWQNRKTKTS